jgi:hypothetical protein
VILIDEDDPHVDEIGVTDLPIALDKLMRG